jgi:hypothetical protein
MNQRVKDLIEKCTDECMGVKTVNLEKFSQSLIQDCISEVALMGITHYDNEDIAWAAETIVKNIQHKFYTNY